MILNKCTLLLLIMMAVFYNGVMAMSGGVTADSIDYSNDSSWAVISKQISQPVDIFYVYPTVYADKNMLNMDISDPEMRQKVQFPLVSQLSVYSDSGNVFAPYYRQISGTMIGDMETVPQTENYKKAKSDVVAAFNYYINNLNNGRPFILAGHSQGSMILVDVVKECLNKPEISERMIAAYLIGFSVLKSDIQKYSWMKQATSSKDTGVIISYNTQSPTATGSPVLLPGSISINPLNWTSSAEKADKSLNLGAVFFDSDGSIDREVVGYCGSYIDGNSSALIATPPEKLDVRSFPDGVYHIYDYAFWYRNLQKNVVERIDAYFKKQ